MRANEFIDNYQQLDEITRRGFLKGLAGLAATSLVKPALGGEYQSWDTWKDPRTIQIWDQRHRQLSARALKIFDRLRSILSPEQAARVANLKLIVDDTPKAGTYNLRDNLITLDLSIYWDLSDDTLAYTIAHEMGHAYYRHSGNSSQPAAKSRNNELMADVFGVKLAHQAGYDPNQCFSDLSAKQKAQATSKADTHPGYQERLEHIRQETGVTVSHLQRGIEFLRNNSAVA